MDCYYYNGELYHHGIAGQKWGVQNGPPYPLNSGVSKSNAKRKFDTGKITSKVKSAAKSAKEKISSKVSSSRAKSKETKENSRLKKLDISKMTNEELKKATERMNLESNYNSAYSRLSSSSTSSKGKQFVKAAGSVLSSSLKTVANEQVTKGLRALLNNDPNKELKSETEKLKMESQKSTYENNIATNKEKAEERASTAATKAAADFGTSSNKTAKSFRDATVETAKPTSKNSSSSLASTKTSSTRFTTNLTREERTQVNEMRKQSYSKATSSYASDGKKYVEVIDYSDLYKKKK